MLDRAQEFLDRLGEPAPEKPPIIPPRWRMPFFLGLAFASLAVLAGFVWFVVMPAVRSRQPAAGSVSLSAPKPRSE